MSKWKGPFEELHDHSLQKGANDVLAAAPDILKEFGVEAKKRKEIMKKLKRRAESVGDRHFYDRDMLYDL